MRLTLIATGILSFALAACSGGEEEQTGQTLDADEVAERIDAAPELRPGQYESKVALIEFDVPGMPASQSDSVKKMMEAEFAKTNTFCLTPEQAEEGPRQMVQQMAKSNCAFSRYDVDGNSLNAEMSCSGGGGMTGSVKVSGSIEGDSSSMVMESVNKVPGMPGEGARMKMQVDSRRIGNCPA